MVERKAAVIQHWIDQGKLAPIDPYHLIFLIWAATQHYADFAPQVKAVMNVSPADAGTISARSSNRCRGSSCTVFSPEGR